MRDPRGGYPSSDKPWQLPKAPAGPAPGGPRPGVHGCTELTCPHHGEANRAAYNANVRETLARLDGTDETAAEVAAEILTKGDA